jgi:hypothetical protein
MANKKRKNIKPHTLDLKISRLRAKIPKVQLLSIRKATRPHMANLSKQFNTHAAAVGTRTTLSRGRHK